MSRLLLALLAHPAGHSLSPRMHQAALEEAGLDGVYLPFDVPPSRLAEAVRGLDALGFAGANVTLPHKVSVLELAHEVAPSARKAGAANTLVFLGEAASPSPPRPRRIVAHNTDAPGFLAAWEARFGQGSLHARRVLLLGCGGAARAVVLALAEAGFTRLTLLVRDPARGHGFVQGLQEVLSPGQATVLPLCDEVFADVLAAGEAEAVIQCTPLGMSPCPDATPVSWPPGTSWQRPMVMDLVYNPRPTRFLLEARAAGCQTEDGLGMLVEQGAQAFRLWTGRTPSRELMRRALTP